MIEYPLWSGINSHDIDAAEINGAAPTPGIITEGFSSAHIPVLVGMPANLFFEVLYAHFERRAERATHETRASRARAEKQAIRVLPESRFGDSERSHKHYPFVRVGR